MARFFWSASLCGTRTLLGCLSGGHLWSPPDYWDSDDIALEMSDYPNIWTGGSREDFPSFGGFEVAGAGVYLPAADVAFERAVWSVAEEYGG